MPLTDVFRSGNSIGALWQLGESEEELLERLNGKEQIPPSITNQAKRLEWAGARLLTQLLLHEAGFEYLGIEKDQHGKPSPAGCDLHLSLSHSYPYVAAIVDADFPVGIDLEQPKSKLLRVAHRVLSSREAENAGNDVVKHCIYWCAKEVLIKIRGKKDLVLAENIQIDPFSRHEDGEIIGRILVADDQRILNLRYRVTSQYVLVYNLTPN